MVLPVTGVFSIFFSVWTLARKNHFHTRATQFAARGLDLTIVLFDDFPSDR
ncbi:hypothetical protein D3C75_814250 [compost metagenome]